MIKVIKRDGRKVDFDKDKIIIAIEKAMKYGSGIHDRHLAEEIADEIEIAIDGQSLVKISNIEDMVFNNLLEHNQRSTARAYEGYRKVREYQRVSGSIDSSVLGIVNGTNKSVMTENSNKNANILSTQRDLIAGEVSKDIARRLKIPTHIIQAHDDGIIHYHDQDYAIQNMFNCCLVNLEDMLQNGTVINGKMIESPKSFSTACTVATQIVQQVANGQFGGQTISLTHLAPFVRKSYIKHKDFISKSNELYQLNLSECQINKIAKDLTSKEIKNGVQTIQYQVNTFSSSNGQAPFLSIYMDINENPEYTKEVSMIIEEFLNQRYIGMKNPDGVLITPSFPKLLYVLDENNVPKDSEYRWLTDLSVKVASKRMNPDFISAKKMRENYEGQVFGCMGCRSFLSTYKDENNKYKFYGRFNQGVVTLNLVDVAISSNKNIDLFWKVLSERMELVKDALMVKHNSLKGTISDVSPVHWQHGAIARLNPGETIDKYLYDGYSTISFGFIGLYETVKFLIGDTHTSLTGEKLALNIMNTMRDRVDKWKRETNIGFSLYGTPSESTTDRFARTLKRKYGEIEGITTNGYLTNSYHVNVKEEINPFDKLSFESQFQNISSGGSVSYVEATNLSHNLPVLESVVDYMYHNIQYAEINTKSDYCGKCGFEGEILLDEKYEWYCPKCGNRDQGKMNVCRRTCGYIGDNFWNEGRTKDIGDRYVHIDNKVLS